VWLILIYYIVIVYVIDHSNYQNLDFFIFISNEGYYYYFVYNKRASAASWHLIYYRILNIIRIKLFKINMGQNYKPKDNMSKGKSEDFKKKV